MASDVGGTREALIDGETGLLCAPGQPADLATAVIDLLRDPKRREAMSRASVKLHRESFGLDRMSPGRWRYTTVRSRGAASLN